MKKLLSLLCVLFVGLSLIGCGSTTSNNIDFDSIPRNEQFIVGLECNYAPFNWTEDSASAYNYPIYNMEGKYANGYDVQIAKAIANSLGKVLVIMAIEWDGLIPALETEKIDAIIAGMSPTEERKTSVTFTAPYYTSEEVCLVLEDGKYANATSIRDFKGALAIGQADTIYDELIPQLVGASHETPLPSVPDIITAMMNGRCDVTIVEKPVALGLVASNQDLKIIEFEEGNGFEVTEDQVAVSVAVRLNETALAEQINGILAGITTEVREKLMLSAVNANN